ncbi:MAG: response regulator, partial [Victivallales bacterium]|nr:response regulator [Victivallales bacterium]
CAFIIVTAQSQMAMLLSILWLVALAAAATVGIIIWRRSISEPLQNISCMVTLAQSEENSKKLQPPHDPEQLELAIKTLLNEKQNSGRTSLLAEMSHEIRTPLNGIIGFISNLNDTPLNQQQKQFLKIIDSSANSLLHVINQILDFAKLDSGSMELENVAFDLKALAQDRCTIAAQLAKSKNVKAYLVFPELQDNPQGTIVRGDPNRLRQVLDNLLSNATKFTSSGEICLEVNIEPTESGKASIRFAVRDTGIGMSPATIQKLFKPYRQADASVARTYGGTGLGLCISASLVKLMGGKLEVHSKLNEGSVFFFTLNLEIASPEEQVRLPGPFTIKLPKAELKKHRALLVDDTPTNLFLLETVCQNAGLPYRTAQNGQEAVDLCLMHKFDIIFMDIQMPVMDGYTAIRKIRQLPNTAMTHIVALTASAFQEDIDRALGAGSTEFIPKPFEKNQLLLCIADALAITPEKILLPQEDRQETEDEQIVRHMHEFMREQYQISLGEIKMTLAQTVADWRPLLDNLKAYCKSGNYSQAREILHKLKGQLSSIGLPQFAETAAVINEAIACNPENPDVQPQIDDLIQRLSTIFKTLEQDVTVV